MSNIKVGEVWRLMMHDYFVGMSDKVIIAEIGGDRVAYLTMTGVYESMMIPKFKMFYAKTR